jgi:hypothetical protein
MTLCRSRSALHLKLCIYASFSAALHLCKVFQLFANLSKFGETDLSPVKKVAVKTHFA